MEGVVCLVHQDRLGHFHLHKASSLVRLAQQALDRDSLVLRVHKVPQVHRDRLVRLVLVSQAAQPAAAPTPAPAPPPPSPPWRQWWDYFFG